ncbi:zinc finger protein 839-like [Phyllostomus discolor]|uniref:Zinc finger protein 839-like n=1 Tax=Phyllostomus discolor TaxID=89673 RepID=A0A7E6D397_9CHIR|nr:zinc finger protein 839-like [Phyllostomus discolor]
MPSCRERSCVPLSCNKINLDQPIRTVHGTDGPQRGSRVTTCFPRCLGSVPPVHRSACHGPEDGHAPPVSDRDPSVPQADGQLNTPADCAAPSGPADPAPSHQDAQLGRPGTLTPEQAVAFPTEDAQGHSSDLHAGDSLGSWGLCSSLTSEGGVASLLPGGSGRSGAGPLGQVPGSCESGQRASPGEAPPLGDALSVRVVPVHAARSAEPEPGPPLSTQGGLGSPAADSDQAPHRTGTHADQRGLGSTAAAGEAVVLGIAGGCSVPPRGPEQTLVQTAGGLLPPRPGSAVSGQEEVATLTEAEGPVLHTCPPEGVLTQPWRQRPPRGTQSEPQSRPCVCFTRGGSASSGACCSDGSAGTDERL